MHFRQKLITVCDRQQTVTLAQAGLSQLKVLSAPKDLSPVGEPFEENGVWKLEVKAGARRITFDSLIVEGLNGETRVVQEIPTRIFGEKECFVCVTATSNFHWGAALHRVSELPWEEWGGDPVTHHGHNFPASANMAEHAHRHGFPVTFLIDAEVAAFAGETLTRWHKEFGDDVGVIPSSFWVNNPINYNTSRTLEEASAVMAQTRKDVQRIFLQHGWDLYPLVAGADQLVGSFGTHWSQASQRNGFRGQWGACFDHPQCDSSCHHEGMPWDVFRTNNQNFRYPAEGDHTLWLFPWTVYDICNSFLEYPAASAYYNSESMNMLFDVQKDYAFRNLNGRVKSMASSEFACVVFHDEDNDIWNPDLIEAMDLFLKEAETIRDQILPATLEEVTQWLDLRYADGSHPANLVEMTDPLTNHEGWKNLRNELFTRWPTFPPNLSWTQPQPEHWQSIDGHNPTMLVSYDATSRWAVREGEHSPRQYIDYSDTSGFSETGMSPKATLPILTNWEEHLSKDNGTLEVRFNADRDFAALPLVWWDRPEIQAPRETARTRVLFTDIHAGANRLVIPLDQSLAGTLRSEVGTTV